MIIYGLPTTGKTSITRAVLASQVVPYAYVNCAECVTSRQLFEKTIAAVIKSLGADSDESAGKARCENVAALAVQLQSLLDRLDKKFVLLLDGIDRQRESPQTLIPAIARLGEMVRVHQRHQVLASALMRTLDSVPYHNLDPLRTIASPFPSPLSGGSSYLLPTLHKARGAQDTTLEPSSGVTASDLKQQHSGHHRPQVLPQLRLHSSRIPYPPHHNSYITYPPSRNKTAVATLYSSSAIRRTASRRHLSRRLGLP